MVVSATDISGKKVTINLTVPYDINPPSAVIKVYDRETDLSFGPFVQQFEVNNPSSETLVNPTKWFNGQKLGLHMTIDIKDNISGLYPTSSQRWDVGGTTHFSDTPNLSMSATYDISDGFSSHEWYDNGYRQAEYIAKDQAGNQLIIRSKFLMDFNAPTKPTNVTNSSGGNCTTSNITVTAKTTEDYSGIKKWQYKFGSSGTWQDKENTTTDFSHTIKSNQDATMYIRAIDKAGNVSESATTTIKKKSSC